MWSSALHPVAADGSGIQWVYTATGTKPLSAYPRPIMARSDVLGAMLLNGEWQFDGGAADVTKPPYSIDLPETIQVPFPPGATASGVPKPTKALFYRRLINGRTLPPRSPDRARLILHLRAASTLHVWVNKLVQLPLAPLYGAAYTNLVSYDVTDAIEGPCAYADAHCPPKVHEVIVGAGALATGLAGTVWLEAVPTSYIRGVAVHSAQAGAARTKIALNVTVDTDVARGLLAAVTISMNGSAIVNVTGPLGGMLQATLPRAQPWPLVYDVHVRITDSRGVLEEDAVTSAFAIQPVSALSRLAVHNGLPLLESGALASGCFYPFFSTVGRREPRGVNTSLTCGSREVARPLLNAATPRRLPHTPSCVFTAPDGRSFDLSPFANRTILATGVDNSYNVSLCGDLPTTCHDALTGAAMPPGNLFSMFRGERAGTCWDVLSHWKDRRSTHFDAKGLTMRFSHQFDAHLGCVGENVTTSVKVACAPSARSPVARGVHVGGCEWAIRVDTAEPAVCSPAPATELG